ncbi:MAG: hypothetical protein MJZ84_06015 [Paludibacteraceae bacterium]|nr:hypothetical protein [Paludibacteraceae bacterium]
MRTSGTSYKRGLAAGLLLLFAVYYVDVNCFVHAHVVNGVTIIHSHIHRNSHHASNDGGHTAWQVNLIASIHSNFLFTESAQATDCNFSECHIETIGSEQDCLAEQIHGIHFVWRAPPMA